ncbi:Radical SAM domain protein [Ammonifex degensii KC4]|uniref:Cyclic dehypoxanthine futalosine synthase n=1 Tax=Ammonifex degensii (strain DSM 10501 / KC4) TaxID=429009 RepID=C9RC41_AMMDK|nr:cyclic dehypoxanthinyl futalosine synthase [Ammonifex degensii]ACX51818.1 Radical SAM domain protein [Ammonifex degensii KC4]
MERLEKLLGEVVEGRRLTVKEALYLYREADLLLLGKAASAVRDRLHPERIVTFVVDRNINYTNVCYCSCLFCAFHRRPEDPDAYVLSTEEVLAKVEELVEQGGTQVLLQGGLHPDLGLDYFEELFRAIKARYPVHLHALSPPEIIHLARKEKLTVREVLERLKAAGLDSVPGGGAEILVNRVRRLISPRKITWQEWMAVMITAFELGLFGSATMMFGTVETVEERIEHLNRLREVQDRTRGFTAFIPWTYQPYNTALGGNPVPTVEYLRLLALSRLFLDNIPNIQASWVTQGTKVGQVALAFGANDFGGTMMEENVVRAAGAAYRTNREEVIRLIKDAGFIPAQRTTDYRIIRFF